MDKIKEIAAALAAYEAENNNKAAIAGNEAILQAFNDLKVLMFKFAQQYCMVRAERAAVENAYTFAEVANETESSAAAVAVAVTVTEDDDDEDSNIRLRENAKNQIIVAYNAFKQQLTEANFPEPASRAWPIITSSILARDGSQFASRHVNTSSSGTDVFSWRGIDSTPVVYEDKVTLIAALKLADASVSPVPVRSMTSMMSEGDSNLLPVAPNSLNVLHNTNIPSRLEVIAAACQTSLDVVNEILEAHKGYLVTSAEVVLPEPEIISSNSVSSSMNNIVSATPPSVELKFTMTDNTVVNTSTPAWSGATTVTAAQGSKSIEQIAADMAEAYYQSKWLEHPEKTKDQFDAFIKTLPAEPVSSRNAQLQGLLLAALNAKGFESFYAAVPMRIPYSTSSSYNSGSNGSRYHGYSSNMCSYQPPTQVYTSAHSSRHVPVPLSLTGTGNNGSLNFSSLVTLQSVTVTT